MVVKALAKVVSASPQALAPLSASELAMYKKALAEQGHHRSAPKSAYNNGKHLDAWGASGGLFGSLPKSALGGPQHR
eukprot:CAMPEP_0114539234 /NCGR_PEP_ID=MMETSP0114-20121206/131_1 /TAXON_ID=31324 /ORGANISM="Goniomonas sp, Strain m" /LENGTH=76 /DNA_ID=CAMNT_0001723327 /DNA_START=27 /DNA_END=257 /DNA_ORIENTATION=-